MWKKKVCIDIYMMWRRYWYKIHECKYMNVLLNKKEYDTIFTLCVVFFKNAPVSKSFQAFPMPLLKQNGE